MTLISTQKFKKTTKKNKWKKFELKRCERCGSKSSSLYFLCIYKKEEEFSIWANFSTFFTTQFTSFPWCRKHTTKIYRDIDIYILGSLEVHGIKLMQRVEVNNNVEDFTSHKNVIDDSKRKWFSFLLLLLHRTLEIVKNLYYIICILKFCITLHKASMNKSFFQGKSFSFPSTIFVDFEELYKWMQRKWIYINHNAMIGTDFRRLIFLRLST